MDDIVAALAEHPIAVTPYTAIRYARRDGQGTLLYRVNGKDLGAVRALQAAHRLHGSTCLYCGRPMPADATDNLFTLDHVHPKALGGVDELYNLVFCCRPCNTSKGAAALAEFNTQRAVDYTLALERHHLRCLNALTQRPAVAIAAA